MSSHETSVPNKPSGASSIRYLILSWLCLAATIAYVSRNSFSLVEKKVREELNLDPSDTGAVMSCFFLTYAILQIPAGWFAQTKGSRFAIAAFAGAWSIATGLGAVSGTIVTLTVIWGLNGAAQAGLFSGCTRSIAKWFPKLEHGFANGALMSFMSAGGAIGAIITGELADAIGWRGTLVVYAVVGLVWTIGFWFSFRDTPAEHSSVSPAELVHIRDGHVDTSANSSAAPIVPTPWLEMFLSPALWWICGQQFFRACGYVFFSTWFATYLQEARGTKLTEAGFLTSMPLFAIVIGGLVGGAASDAILRITGSRRLARQGVAIVSLLICSLLIFVAYGISNVYLAVAVISAGTFFFALSGPSAYTITIDMGGEHVAPLFSVMNMCGNLGATLFPLAVPKLLRLTGNWHHVLLLFGGLYIAAAFCWICLSPNGTVFDQSLLRRRKFAA